MISMGMFLQKLRRVKLKEAKDVWKLPVALVAMPFFRMRHRDLWIVCEDANEARDNGYWFFKHVREHHPAQEIIYAIRRTSPDFDKVSVLGRTVEFGSLRHWVAYLGSRKKISSQKAGNPNAAIFYALEVYGLLRDTRIFLQHGITKDDALWLHYDVTRMSRFMCGAKPEHDFVTKEFGYPEGAVRYAGFCRFDELHNPQVNKRLVLIMPTWREWIADEDWRLEAYEGTTIVPETNYFKRWNEFLSDERLLRIASEHGVRFVFYPHRNMQKYLQFFPKSTQEVQVVGAAEWDIQALLKEAALMITDYSSVFFDFVYMRKPVIFYQFDYDQFRAGQYAEGWFDYRQTAFGKSCTTQDEVFEQMEDIISSGYAVSDAYKDEHARCFPLFDDHNCERTYQIVRDA